MSLWRDKLNTKPRKAQGKPKIEKVYIDSGVKVTRLEPSPEWGHTHKHVRGRNRKPLKGHMG